MCGSCSSNNISWRGCSNGVRRCSGTCGGDITAWLYEELIQCGRPEAAQALTTTQQNGRVQWIFHCTGIQFGVLLQEMAGCDVDFIDGWSENIVPSSVQMTPTIHTSSPNDTKMTKVTMAPMSGHRIERQNVRPLYWRPLIPRPQITTTLSMK